MRQEGGGLLQGRRRLLLKRAAVSLAVLLLAGEARADDAARLAALTRILAREQASTRLWYDGWVGFFGAATLVELQLARNATTRNTRLTGLVGASKAGIAFTFMLANGAGGRTAADTLARMPERTPEERRAKLRRAEAMLRAIAAEERARRGLFPVLGGAALNLAGAFTLWGASRGGAMAGWFGLVQGVAISQLQLHTQPRGAIRAWEAYQRGEESAKGAAAGIEIAPVGGGIGVVGRF